MARFEIDLAAKDYAAKEKAQGLEAQMGADLRQFDMQQDKDWLAFNQAYDLHNSQMANTMYNTLVGEGVGDEEANRRVNTKFRNRRNTWSI